MVARLPTPVDAKACAVPPDKGVSANNQHGSGDRRKQPIKPDEEKPIRVREFHPAAQAASANLNRNGVARRAKSRRISAIIAADASPIRHRVKPDGFFGTHSHRVPWIARATL
jgi:hypothetical protein